ncbi:flagellar hook-associated protein FlgK [Roseburia sp. BX1005]|uniref:Flagellar hook-associated protein 1 n=1 Tax=Roseburia zhanii TaxID=2763064 RepID=A0A923LKQ2_9FIRM|nr:flagellar hook-associated protein FlgK [Roseburia zhanii]MBC5712610.1 flagellar hook-associated protein FlgK [Roseburia zhanii]
MPSTFFGLNIASSALNAFQTAVNTTANNISNVQTKGYTKQVANRQASDALRVYQKYGTIGTGVTTTSITSIRSEYYDTKYWENQSSVGMFETKLNFLNQIENYFQDKESNEPGFSTIFTNMFNQLNELTSNAGDENVRKNFISQAQIFTSYFHDVSNGLVKLQKDCNDQIKTLVESINSSAQKIAALTKQINSIEIQGGTANELRDQRALIIDELSKIVPITAAESPVTNSNYPDMYTGGTNYIVKIDGQTLVNNYEYTTLKCVSRENQVWQTDAEGLYDIVWADTGMNFNMNADSMDGSLKALFDIRDGNNEENFQGKITSATSSTITIKPSTMNTIETMSMASEGVITIKNKEYYYNSFTAEVDENGKILSYKFEIEANLDANEINNLRGGYAEIGDKIDAMGIPYYMSQMSEFLRAFSERFNAYQKGGQDLNGDPMGAFFIAKKYDGSEYDFADQNVGTNGVTDGTKSVISSTSNSYYQMNALNFNVADASIRDSSIFATTADVTGEKIDAHEIVDAMLKLQSDVKLFRGGSAKSFLQCIISDITIDTQESKIFSSNFTDIASAITNQRLSIAGVDEDEEALDIVKFQNAYNLASRMVQCMSEMYDKLINETGV